MYAIATLMHNVTTVWACVVAGLGSQLAAVDPAIPRVALVQGGRVLGSGTHEVLLRDCAEYANLVRRPLRAAASSARRAS